MINTYLRRALEGASRGGPDARRSPLGATADLAVGGPPLGECRQLAAGDLGFLKEKSRWRRWHGNPPCRMI